jgi:hypothetical protein
MTTGIGQPLYPMAYNVYMKKTWRDPVKGRPPSPETLAITGDWGSFTEDMKKLLGKRQTEKQKTTSASPGPVSSS